LWSYKTLFQPLRRRETNFETDYKKVMLKT
jgi:hypothetical protein